jgi:hypothetical protein
MVLQMARPQTRKGSASIQYEKRIPADVNEAPGCRVTELHVYPHSRGRVPRHIGEAIDEAVELVVEHHLAGIIEFCSTRRTGKTKIA